MEGSLDLMEVTLRSLLILNTNTLLTLTQNNGNTLFCPPIGHRQERGDYQESWQPMPMVDDRLQEAQEMAAKVTTALGGSGIWGGVFYM